MKPLKILYVDTEQVWRGGQEQLYTLIRGLQARGHQCFLAAPGGAPLAERCRALKVPVEDFQQRSEWSPKAFRRLREVMLGENFQVVHFNTPRPILAGGLAAKLCGVPLRVSSRRVIFPLSSPFSRWKYNACNDLIFTVCDSIRQVLTQAGVNRQRVRVVYEGVDLRWFDDLEAAEFQRGLDEVWIGIVAHLSHEKGHRDLLEAASLLASRFSDVRYAIIGDGPLRQELEALSQELRLDDFVRFTGFRKDSEALMKRLDVFCLPSHSEGFSSAVLAAMANRLPVVASAVGGNRELVTDGETGLLVPPGEPAQLAEALWKLIDSQTLRHRMGQAGRKRVEDNFTMERKIELSERLYREWLEKK
ncbi:MAG TPA: glycosyltransferase family 4 protein [Acidobacteriota bacterium]|nr:glycosyltransferase family 4 protein [Acidobacteriota bacterium]